MKILITGGAGFIARHLRENLSSEYELVAPNSQELNLLETERVAEFLKSNKFDAVIHTATYDAAPKHSPKDPAKVLENNLRMFFGLARCHDLFKKMIFFGTGAEFDRKHWRPKMKEEYFDRHVPADQYGLSKYIMTKHALASEKIYNLRLFALFGKYEDWRVRVISSICHDVVNDQPIKIHQNRFFDFTCVNDLVRVVKWLLANKPEHKVYNVCSGQVADFKTIAEKVLKFSGKNLPVEIQQPGLGIEYSGDNSRLLKELKGFKFTPIDDSIKALYQWFDENK